jgi:predicted nucleic acid-binding protein
MPQPITTQPSVLLDTGPLSVLCGFPFNDTPYLVTVLNYTKIILSDGVVSEIMAAQKGKIARVISPFLKSKQIVTISTSNIPPILDTAYDKLLGIGERSTIKAALAHDLTLVIDDKDAFMVASRFGLQPMVFQDFIISLSLDYAMPKHIAIEIARATARQFPAPFLTHTLAVLS